MYNIGFQNGQVGTEGKTTVDSSSYLPILPSSHSGRLRICRLGAMIHMFRWLDDEGGWTETHTFERDDFPQTLEVGLVVNAWEQVNTMAATFDYVRFGAVSNLAGCTGSL